MNTKWFRHLRPEDQANFKAAVLNSTTALNRLRDIILEDLNSLEVSEFTEAQFEDPNWSFKQSYRNGQRSKLKNILNLLDFDPK